MALEALDKIYFQLVEQLLPRDPQRQKEYRQLLENAVKFYEQFAEQNRDDSTVRHEVGGAYRRVGSIYQLLGRYDKANEAWTKWGQVVAELAAEFPGESIYRAELGGSYYNLGTLLQEEGARQAAEDHYRYAFVVWDQLAKDFPENPMYRRCVACAYRSLGDLYRADGKWGSAAERYHQTIDLMTRVVNERPDALKYLGELANVRNELGTALKEQGEWVAAKKQYREAIDILTDVVKKCPAVHQNPTELKYNKAPSVHEFRADLASAHYNFGELLMEDGDWKLAEEHHGEALGLRKQLVKDCPPIPQYSLGLAESLINLGSRLHEDGECAEAELNYGQAIGLLTKLVNNHPGLPEYRLDLARGQRSLASLLADVGRSAEGDKALDDALARCQELTKRWPGVPEYLEELATGWLLLGDLRAARGREREAKDAWRKFLELAPDTRHTQERKAWLLATCFDPEFRNPDQAILLAKKATDKAPRSRRALQALGVVSYRNGDWQAAADALNESLRFSKAGNAASLFFLAMAHWQLGDKNQAAKCYDQAVQAMEKNQPNQHALLRFRREGSALLQIQEEKGSYKDPKDTKKLTN